LEDEGRNVIRLEEVSAARTLSLRCAVLRPAMVPDEALFSGGMPEGARHFAAIDGKCIVGVCFIVPASAPFDAAKRAWMLRGMAVEPPLQGQGIGGSLVRHVLALAEEEQVEILWFNARRISVGFYAKLGFHKWGEEFDIPNVGPHLVMFRTLVP